jgi:hypothetical protein
VRVSFGIVELVRNRKTMEPMAPLNGSSPEMTALSQCFRDSGSLIHPKVVCAAELGSCVPARRSP